MNQTELIWSQIERSFISRRLAHAWMVVGSPQRNGLELARRMAGLVLSEGQDEEGRGRVTALVESGTHPDLAVIEPHSKSRRITVDEIRELNIRLHTTSYEGGWKVAMIQHADRLVANAANAFLKTLEEPPERTLILLLTDSPQAMLNTIVSRCQRIILSEELADLGDPVWSEHVQTLLCQGWPSDAGAALVMTSGMCAILDEQEAEVSQRIKQENDEAVTKDEREARVAAQLIQIRADLVEHMIEWYRDVLIQSYLGGEETLYFPHKKEDTRREASRLFGSGAQECLERLWSLQQSLDRNVPFQRAVLNALRPIRLMPAPKSVV